MSSAVRAPAVAGRFYPGSAEGLAADLRRLTPSGVAAEPATMVMGPHAGYVYSGAILAETYAAVEVPRRVLLLGPNHTGLGARVSLYDGAAWALPGSKVPIDRPLLEAVAAAGVGRFDVEAHRLEHALEVHVPFLLDRQPELRLAPVCLAGLSVGDCERLGAVVAQVVGAAEEPILLAVSSDMNHFASAELGRKLDMRALDRLLALDPVGLYRVVREGGISMCGVIPATVGLFAARALGARAARLIRYGHSGEVSGDESRVVGYAGVVIT